MWKIRNLNYSLLEFRLFYCIFKYLTKEKSKAKYVVDASGFEKIVNLSFLDGEIVKLSFLNGECL